MLHTYAEGVELTERTVVLGHLRDLNTCLSEYCSFAYPMSRDRFGQLLLLLPDLRLACIKFEECLASIIDSNDSSLLVELLTCKV
jgi:hypothetical protein